MSHKTNGGLSDARNAGVEICHGEYIVFVDSDDYVDTEFIQKMYQSLVDSSSDVAMCSVIWEDENGKPLLNSPAAAFARDVVSGRACMELTYSNPNAVTAWNKRCIIARCGTICVFQKVNFMKTSLFSMKSCINVIVLRHFLTSYIIMFSIREASCMRSTISVILTEPMRGYSVCNLSSSMMNNQE